VGAGNLQKKLDLLQLLIGHRSKTNRQREASIPSWDVTEELKEIRAHLHPPCSSQTNPQDLN